MTDSLSIFMDKRESQLVYNELYERESDPWGHCTNSTHLQLDRDLMYKSLSLLGVQYSDLSKKRLLVEIGCGFGQNVQTLEELGFDVIGTDVSSVAIDKGRSMYPERQLMALDVTSQQFSEFLEEKKPDILYFCHVTWCIISKFDQVLNTLKDYSQSLSKDVYLAHLSAIYPSGVQQHGADKFTNSREFIQYVKPSEVIFEGEIWPDQKSGSAFLLSKI